MKSTKIFGHIRALKAQITETPTSFPFPASCVTQYQRGKNATYVCHLTEVDGLKFCTNSTVGPVFGLAVYFNNLEKDPKDFHRGLRDSYRKFMEVNNTLMMGTERDLDL